MKKYSRIILSIPQEDYCITASPGEYPLASTLMTAPYTNLSLRTLSVKCRMLWLTWKDGLCRIKWSWMLKRPKICGSPSRSPVQFLLLLISGLLNWRGFQSLNNWVYMYRTISSGIHMSQVLSAKRVNGSTILRSVEQPISPGTLVLQLTPLRLELF